MENFLSSGPRGHGDPGVTPTADGLVQARTLKDRRVGSAATSRRRSILSSMPPEVNVGGASRQGQGDPRGSFRGQDFSACAAGRLMVSGQWRPVGLQSVQHFALLCIPRTTQPKDTVLHRREFHFPKISLCNLSRLEPPAPSIWFANHGRLLENRATAIVVLCVRCEPKVVCFLP